MFRLLVTNLLIIAVVALIDNANYEAVLRLTQQELYHKKLGVAQQTMDVLEDRLETAGAFSLRVSQSMGVQRLLRLGANKAEAAALLYDTIPDLQNYSRHNAFIEDYFLYFPGSNVFLSRQYGLSSGLTHVYGNRLQYEALDAEGFTALLLSRHYTNALLFPRAMRWEDRTGPRIVHVQTLPFENVSLRKGVLVCLIDMGQVNALLMPLAEGPGEAVYLLDAEGALLYTYGDAQAQAPGIQAMEAPSAFFLQGDSFVSYTRSPATGWLYVVQSPLSSVTRVVDGARSQHVYTRLACLVLCVLLSVLTAHWHARPLRQSAARIRTVLPNMRLPAPANFRSMAEDLTSLLSRYSMLEASVGQQQALLRSAFFDALVYGRYTEEAHMRRHMQQAEIHLPGPWYTAVLMEAQGGEGGAALLTLEAVWSGLCPYAYLHGISERRVLALFSSDAEDAAGAQRHLVAAADAAVRRLSVPETSQVRLTAGALTDELLRIQQAYIQATHLMNNEPSHESDPISIYTSQKARWSVRLYLPEDEEKLINLLHTGMPAEVSAMLDRVFGKSVGLVGDLKRQQYGQLRAGLLRAMDRLPAKETDAEAKALQEELLFMVLTGADADRDRLIRTAHAIHGLFQRRMGAQEELLARLQAYLDAHLADPMLGLGSCSQALNRSEVYLSQVFKERMGENLSVYVEGRRIEQARRLIAETDQSMEQIAAACGYSSADTFRKAFKRRTGATPIHYRRTRMAEMG